MKNSTIQKIILSCALFAFTLSIGYGQVKQIVWFASDDITIGSGDNFKDVVMGGQLQMCNFDHNETLMSYFESWVKFDFTTIEDSIPDGQSILYADIKFRVSNNAGPQGTTMYHLLAIDDWTQDALTWNLAQTLNYETEGNFDQFAVILPEDAGGTSSRPEANVTDQVLYELGDEGNKLLTIRLEPYVKDYIENDPYYDKKWLGFYSREVIWDDDGDPETPNLYCPQITLYIGPEEPTVFSDDASFGDIGNFTVMPEKYGYWLVRDDDGDARLRLDLRPSPLGGTPGAVAVYKDETYTDFDLTVKARLDKEKDGGLDPKTDFAIVFGHKSNLEYSYLLLTGEDINGFYTVDTVGGIHKTEVGALNTTPAVADLAYHDYRLVRTGTTVTAYIDGTEYMSVTDAALGVEGMIGVGSYNDVVYFDDFIEGEGGDPGAINDLNQTRFSLYPNPAGDQVHIESESIIKKLVISNILGQEILSLNNIGLNSLNIDISGFKRGIYLITLEDLTHRPSTSKLIIK